MATEPIKYNSLREQIEESWLPHCLRIGVPYELFWSFNPRKVRPFEKNFNSGENQRHKEKFDYINTGSWLNGLYVAHAITACLSKNAKYPEKPIDFNVQNQEEKSNKENAEIFKEYVVAFNEKFKKKNKESVVD